MMDEIVPESRLSFAINEDARDLWLARREAASRLDEQIYFQFATRFLELGENLLAFDAAQEGLQCWPDSLELLNSKALSLARSGAYREANVLLENLYAKGASDHETVGLLARTYKDLWEAAKTPNQGAPFLRRALALYEKTYLETGAYWFGINAATLAVAKGDLSLARTYASQIRNSLIPLLEIDNLANENRYWMLATLGESALIEGDLPAAEEWYARALTSSSAGSGSIASSRRNAKLLASYGCCKISFVNKVLPQARICVFSGHRAEIGRAHV